MLDTELREQLILVEDVARKYFEQNYSFENRQNIVVEDPGYSLEQWQTMVDLGWMKLPIDTEYGGLGCSIDFVSTLMKEFGKSLFVSPYMISVGIASRILEWDASEAIKSKLLRGLGDGTEIVSCAFYEAQSRYNLEKLSTTAKQKNGLYVLNGAKIAVDFGVAATQLLVLANTPGTLNDENGLSLFLVPVNRDGVELKHYCTHDGGRVSSLTLNKVQLSSEELIGTLGSGSTTVQKAINYGNALVCAQMTGVLETVMELTLAHIKTRKQFGKAISSFQAIQHRVVDMYMRCELAKSMSLEAIRAIEEFELPQQNSMVSAAKFEIGRAAVLNAEEGVQLHGAMGMMDEMLIGHCLKRIFTLNLMFGDPDYHLNRYRTLNLDSPTLS